jgi:endonuclease-3
MRVAMAQRTSGKTGTTPRRMTTADAGRLIDALARAHPEATCALTYRNPFELLVATILSAQCTDQRVNLVTPALFSRFPTSAALAVAAPSEVELLIGRKTANVVLSHAFEIHEGLAVDTHVLRVSNRLGLAHGEDPVEVERQLMAVLPAARWGQTSDVLIFHGRKVCAARKPACGGCPVFAPCAWPEREAFAHVPQSLAGTRDRKTRPSGRPATAARRGKR